MGKVEISVLMPVFNAELYLDKSIKSYMMQTYKDTELIIVDDMSTDASYQICRRYAEMDGRIHVYQLKENMGAAKARKYAFERARGKWFIGLDADDWMDDDWLGTLFSATLEDDEIDSVIGNCRLRSFDGNGNEVTEDRICFDKEFTFWSREELVFLAANTIAARINAGNNTGVRALRSCSCFWDKLYRTEVVRLNNLSLAQLEAWGGEDVRFTFQFILRCRKVRYIHEVGYNYRVHTNSISHRLTTNRQYRIQNEKSWEYLYNKTRDTNDELRHAVTVYAIRRLMVDIDQYFLPKKKECGNDDWQEEMLQWLSNEHLRECLDEVSLGDLSDREIQLYNYMKLRDIDAIFSLFCDETD